MHTHGHHIDPPLLRPRRRDQQHLQHQEAPKRRRLRRARRVYGGAEICNSSPHPPLLLRLPLAFDPLPEPGEFSHQLPAGNLERHRDAGVRVGAAGEGVYAEYGGEQVVLRGAAACAVDIWAGAGFSVLRNNGARAL